ncbi:hypothetical protein [Paludisphaera rhizosphaerae]|uniref:hypothetical protein n=1 Tax=Paludisphaera rhizosphaerae TaxID=2711216 RepID=UPI0013EBD6E4|nr:hypothetical protein [Paludisphaera rhizosphaerae]
MRLRRSTGGLLDAIVRQSGVIAFAGLAVLLVLVPLRLHYSLGADPADEVPLDASRTVARVILEESSGSKGFEKLAAAVSQLSDQPTQEAIRRLMEEQGCTDLHYSRRLRWVLRDGHDYTITYNLIPYDDVDGVYREHLLDFLKHGPESTPRLLFDESDAPGPLERDTEAETLKNFHP